MKPELYLIWASPLSATLAILLGAVTLTVGAYVLIRISPRVFTAAFACCVVAAILWGGYNYYAIVTGMTPDEKAISAYRTLASKHRDVLVRKIQQTRQRLELMERELDSAPSE